MVGGTDGNFVAPDLAGRFDMGEHFVLTARPQWRFRFGEITPFGSGSSLPGSNASRGIR